MEIGIYSVEYLLLLPYLQTCLLGKLKVIVFKTVSTFVSTFKEKTAKVFIFSGLIFYFVARRGIEPLLPE